MSGLLVTIVGLVAAFGGLALYLKQERLEKLEAHLGARDRELDEERRRVEEVLEDLERREHLVAAREAEREEAEVLASGAVPDMPLVERARIGNGGGPRNHADEAVSLVFVAGLRYRLLEIEPRLLTPGSDVDLDADLDGRTYVVARVGRSPLPADGRRCAYVEPSTRAAAEGSQEWPKPRSPVAT
jgi:hypothetical protein